MHDILSFKNTPYFAFGQQQKSSLIAEFCRQNKYQHIKNPILEAVQNVFANHAIIEGSVQLFEALELKRPELQVVFVGSNFTERQLQIRRDYKKIGKCIQVNQFNYDKFRKAMYPNLIFFYGPIQEQNLTCANALANQIGYCRVHLPPNANNFIQQFKKTVNYTVCGLFTQKQQITILQQFFNIKIIHLKYNRIDLSNKNEYFDKQFELLSFLKSKPYYHAIDGFSNDIKVMNEASQALSPSLIYAQVDTLQNRKYLDDYVQRNQQTALILSIFEIQSINKRKNIALAQTPLHRVNLLNEILYRDFKIQRAIILDFPYLLPDIINFQNANRKFEAFIDLLTPQNVVYFKEYVTSMYFLQNQKLIVPNTAKPLQDYLNSSIKYWIVNGPSGSGKTTVSKYLVSEYGFKLIQYEPYFASIKQKLLAPEDGEEVPLRKTLAHFKTLLNQNPNDIYVIDGLSFDNKDLEQWINVIGAPSVINLEVQERQTIKRLRKKNQADVNAEVNEEQLAKAKQSLAKSQNWLERVRNLLPALQINELNFNSPLILAENLIHKIFKKNIYLVQSHNGLAFQNIALKYNLGFINLFFIPLRQSVNAVRKMPNKDVIICYYLQNDEKLISDDLYWIQKNLGNIKYLAIWQPEQIQVHEQKILLQKPIVPQKVKVQGAQGEQKPPEQQPADKKDKFDIFAYQWTKPVNSKNLSQWFTKSKKQITKIQSAHGKQLFEKWGSIQQTLQQSQNNAVYQTFK